MTLTTDELTDLLNEDAAERIKARTLANIARRAETLFQDGYTCEPQQKTEHFQNFQVRTPAGAYYNVHLSDTPDDETYGDHCTCLCWEKWGECKHHSAVLSNAWETEQCEAHDALHTDSDDDAYAEY